MNDSGNIALREKLRLHARLGLCFCGLLCHWLTGCQSDKPPKVLIPSHHHTLILTNFDTFERQSAEPGEIVLVSPKLEVPSGWDELVLSWNALAKNGAGILFEARAWQQGNPTRYYTMGLWAQDSSLSPRTSKRGQKDQDGEVRTDTLVLNEPAQELQIRLTLTHSPNAPLPKVKLLGISCVNSSGAPISRLPNRQVWGHQLLVPQRSQLGHPDGEGWCSPTSVSMVMAYWASVLQRPELDRTVTEVARGVFDPGWGGTGNWAFNTAYPGQYENMQAWVARLPDLRAIEDYIQQGIPVVTSVSLDLLRGGDRDLGNGHLVVCTGFTGDGDVVTNDPWANLDRGEKVRRVYQREVFQRAWKRSRQTVYLIVPNGI